MALSLYGNDRHAFVLDVKINCMKQESQKLALPCEGGNMRRLSYNRLNITVSALMMTQSQQ
jgi:hypothetical protein